jgi:hypothetical protein
VSSNKAHIIKAITNNADISSITAIYTLETESGLDINCIKIHPIPDMKAEITSVVTDTINGAIENVTDTNGTSVMFPAAVEDKPYFKRKKSFRFPAKKIANLTVNITNDEYDVIDNLGSKQFILGARVISMESVTYLNSGYLGFKLPIPAGKSKVHKVIPSYEGTPDNIELTVYDIEDEFNEIGDQYLLTGTADVIDDIVDTVITNLSAEYIYVLIKMTKQINESTPILKGLVVSWS